MPHLPADHPAIIGWLLAVEEHREIAVLVAPRLCDARMDTDVARHGGQLAKLVDNLFELDARAAPAS